jgi:hypothetical protein
LLLISFFSTLNGWSTTFKCCKNKKSINLKKDPHFTCMLWVSKVQTWLHLLACLYIAFLLYHHQCGTSHLGFQQNPVMHVICKLVINESPKFRGTHHSCSLMTYHQAPMRLHPVYILPYDIKNMPRMCT